MIVIITDELFNTEYLTVESEWMSESNHYNLKQSTLLIFSTRDSSEVRVHHRASSKTWKWNTCLPFPSLLPFSVAGSDRQSTLPTDTLASMQQRLDLWPPSFHCGCSVFGILSRRFCCLSPSEPRSEDRELPRIKFRMHGSRFSCWAVQAGSILSVLCRCLVQGSERWYTLSSHLTPVWKDEHFVYVFYLWKHFLIVSVPVSFHWLQLSAFIFVPVNLCVTFSLNKVWKIDWLIISYTFVFSS